MTHTWTIKTLLDWSVDFFQKKEIESPRLDAEVLLAHVLKLKRIDLYLQFDRPLTQEELANYKILLKRRAEHEPAVYILGEKEFGWNLLRGTPAVLIPRPDTEVLVEQVLKKMKGEHIGSPLQKSIFGLEIGLGSGIISTILLLECPNLKMHAVEISKEAIDIAKENLARHNVSDRIEIFEKDFLNWESPKEKYDFLVSNPPYVKEKEYSHLSKTVRDFEPKHAILAGATGLEFHEALAKRVKNFVKPGGFIAVEIGEDQGQSVLEIFKNVAGAYGLSAEALAKEDHTPLLIQDYARKDRVVIADL